MNNPYKNQHIELAKAYVALSNAHQLNLVFALFAEDAIYQSENVGVFRGKAANSQMMIGFFTKFPDVYWQAENYRLTEDGVVLFDFEMTATEIDTGSVIVRSGVEEVYYSTEEFIEKLIVQNN